MSKVQSPEKTNYEELLYDLTYEAANRCIQCGYCLPVCPTYDSMENESQSPRGRINLVKMAAEGKINIQDDLAGPIELCLGCRACEVACPVNVPYGEIYEGALEVINKQKEKKAKNKQMKSNKVLDITLNQLFPHKKRLRTIGNFTWFYQNSGLNKMMRKSGVIEKVSKPMGQFEKVLPKIESPSKRYKYNHIYKPIGEKRISVAFFPGCIMDSVMSKANRLTIELLQKCGCEVWIPKSPTCCGALHAHKGKINGAKDLARQNIEAFENMDVQYIINNAGGCGAMLYEYDELLKDDNVWNERAKKFSKKSKDVTEVLYELAPLPFEKEWKGLITYQDSCHLRNVQGVIDAPRELLRSIPGATYIEMKDSYLCCASGGIYNLLHFDESMQILDEKMKHAVATKAKTIVTTNPGCLLQMKLGIERNDATISMKAYHLIEILAESCGVK